MNTTPLWDAYQSAEIVETTTFPRHLQALQIQQRDLHNDRQTRIHIHTRERTQVHMQAQNTHIQAQNKG
jgi:hypothetical protein